LNDQRFFVLRSWFFGVVLRSWFFVVVLRSWFFVLGSFQCKKQELRADGPSMNGESRTRNGNVERRT